MNTNENEKMIETLIRIKKEYGESIFDDSRRLNSMLKDLLVGDVRYDQCRGKINALMYALDENVFEKLTRCRDNPVKTQEHCFKELSGIYNSETALFVVNSLSVIVGIKRMEISVEEKESKGPAVSEHAPNPKASTPVHDFEIEDDVLISYIGKDEDVIIPDCVSEINAFAFKDCSLESITIPKTVKSIGDFAFSKCSSLESVNMAEGIIEIGENAFSECSSLKNITIPKGVKIIKEDTFYKCSLLESITLPDSINSIGNGAFCDCSSLKNVTIPKNVKRIGRDAFFKCSSLESINIPENVNKIEDYTFNSCYSLKDITIPKNLEIIGEYAFSFCSSLKEIRIPNSVKIIGTLAFSLCPSLTIYVEGGQKPGWSSNWNSRCPVVWNTLPSP